MPLCRGIDIGMRSGRVDSFEDGLDEGIRESHNYFFALRSALRLRSDEEQSPALLSAKLFLHFSIFHAPDFSLLGKISWEEIQICGGK